MRRLASILALGIVSCVLSWGQTAPIDDPLHGCMIGTNCFDNGTVTPATANPLPKFTFTVSPGPNAGDFLVDILIPDDVSGANSLSFSISGTNGGAGDNVNIGPAASTLEGHWTSGDLNTLLGLTLANGSPDNKIDAWLGYTQTNGDPGAAGYYVYQVDLGTNQLQGPSNPTAPVLTLSGSPLPVASLLVGFLGQTVTTQSGKCNGKADPNNPCITTTSTDYISTANSGAIFEPGAPGTVVTTGGQVPEPASVLLFGSLAILCGSVLRKKASRQN